jgi:hypothetical protein
MKYDNIQDVLARCTLWPDEPDRDAFSVWLRRKRKDGPFASSVCVGPLDLPLCYKQQVQIGPLLFTHSGTSHDKVKTEAVDTLRPRHRHDRPAPTS